MPKPLTDEEKMHAFDVIAKALLVRLGGTAKLTKQEMEDACQFQGQLNFDMNDGTWIFKIEAN